MKMDGYRYALQYKDPTKGWTTRLSGDDRALVMKMWRDQPTKANWRVVDRSTDAVISEAA